MANIIKRTIDLSVFPTNKTIFWILEEQGEIKERIKAYTDEINKRFPSVGIMIAVKWETCQAQFDEMTNANTSHDDFLEFVNDFNHEGGITEPASQDAKDELTKLFKVNDSDNELTKLLKEIANDEEQKNLLEASLENLSEKGVSWVIFLLETLENFYLTTYLPQYINDELAIEPVIKLGEVRELIKPILTDLFAELYSSYNKVEQVGDLDQLKTNAETQLKKLKKSINDYKATKKPKEPDQPNKPTEDIEALKKELEDTKLELKDLYTYIEEVLDRLAQQDNYILVDEPDKITTEPEKIT